MNLLGFTQQIHQFSDLYPNMNSLLLPTLRFRTFLGEADYPVITSIINACKEADGMDHSTMLEDVRNTYTHLVKCDPYRDMLFAEVEGRAVGYTRAWCQVDGDGNWIGFSLGYVVPAYRRRGIGRNLLDFVETRLKEISNHLIETGQLSPTAPRFFDNSVSDTEIAKESLLKHAGYQAVRFEYDMVRPDLENIPDLPLPAGLEVRPVLPEHYRPIFDADNEAFRDHWGYIPASEEDFQKILTDSVFDPTLWRVAWAGDQIAGMVLSFINRAENAEFNRKRGYTEDICVLRPWRKQGLAKALIALSLKALKERGMDHATLGVDAENISGATHLYEKMGYRVVSRARIYRKAF
jgi:mycothiol synthase